ncbi:MAG TPA: LapA family protein [Burkholderiales bacterium]|nr:LapA family protein [Burkholderiales bacterium]
MRYLLWVLKFALFAVAVTLAIKNTDAVAVRYFLGYEWRAPLILVLFVFLCIGAVLGFFGAFGQILRQRREIGFLRRGQQASAAAPAHDPPPPDIAGV